jgi:hypothetical protein
VTKQTKQNYSHFFCCIHAEYANHLSGEDWRICKNLLENDSTNPPKKTNTQKN